MHTNKEVIFNFFPILKNDIIRKIGYTTHDISGTDEEKISFLKSKIDSDMSKITYISIPKSFKVSKPGVSEMIGISLSQYNNLVLNNTIAVLFEPAFDMFDSSETPLFIATVIKNGQIKITESVKAEIDYGAPFVKGIKEEIPEYYLKEYVVDGFLEIERLMDDDLFQATKLLLENKNYVSVVKLIVSAIDTMSFLEFGDINGNFKQWVEKYFDLVKVGISSSELWEYRNAILHMTNSESRKVIKKEIKALRFYISDKELPMLNKDGEFNYFNITTLIEELNLAINKWGKDLNAYQNKFKNFIERYDTIISDSRYGKIEFHG